MSATAGAAPGLAAVLETSLYHGASETAAMRRFYAELLGLREVSHWPGGCALRLGSGVLLLFEREALAERDGPIAQHGSTGPGHVCLLAADAAGYEAWRERLPAAGIEITHEHVWDAGPRSLYFFDPAGNLLEIAAGDLWPR